MAKIAEQLGVFKISKLVRDSDDEKLDILTTEVKNSIIAVLEEILGSDFVIEIEEE